ncbi:MAG: MBL fold metallo-hydrolase [Candidatus Gastranaerophilales bacterium]|nr:MBL fold metallo-hydrolase [Candidatus Gastranaerophilales bacterium]
MTINKMELTVLTDNTVLQGKNFLGEHGLSIYIEENDKKILFDTGYSNVFIKNAHKMGINLLNLDYIILSHGHYDHTWGLSHYLSFYSSALKQGENIKKPVILTHPDTFKEKFKENFGEIGCFLSKDKLEKNFNLKLTKEPYLINENFVFLSEIPRLNDFEGKDFIGSILEDNSFKNDYILEDSAIVYKTNQGLVLITGCSHSGICNIIEYAVQICNDSRIVDIIGGFHLVKASNERLVKTADYLSKFSLNKLHPCHCTDFDAKIFLSKKLNLKETGVGTVLEYR